MKKALLLIPLALMLLGGGCSEGETRKVCQDGKCQIMYHAMDEYQTPCVYDSETSARVCGNHTEEPVNLIPQQ